MKRTENNLKSRNYDKLKKDIEMYTELQVPTCLYGEAGKTAFLMSIVPDLIIIDSREIVDIKNLTGFYAVENGDITYVEGILIHALKTGKSVLFKNIDCNVNLYHFLVSVIKSGKITDNHGTVWYADKLFHIYFTAHEKADLQRLYFVGPIEYYLEDAGFDNAQRTLLDNVFDALNKNATNKCLYDCDKECFELCLSGNYDCYDGVSTCLVANRSLCTFHYRKILQLVNIVSSIKKLDHKARLCLYDTICNLFLKHDCEYLLSVFNLNYYPDVILYDTKIAKTYAYTLCLRKLKQNILTKQSSLLVGETGIGKTSVIQYLHKHADKYFGCKPKLKIVNMSPDYDAYDLIGGYASFDVTRAINDLYNKYNVVKPITFDNNQLLQHLKTNIGINEDIILLEKSMCSEARFTWKDGILLDAMKNGYWVLMDEINLCSNETLCVLEAVLAKRQILNYEKKYFKRSEIHPDFMLFACMNPGGDFGKKNIYTNQFNEMFFYDFTNSITDISLVLASIGTGILDTNEIHKVASLMYNIRQKIKSKQLSNKLEPLISGRTLIRAIESIAAHVQINRYDIMSVFLLTQFDLQSRFTVIEMLREIYTPSNNTLKPTHIDQGYVLTPKTQIMLHDICNAITINVPLLIQGDTSIGKTSMVYYLASKYEKKVVRINNHEHTEASDYLGYYTTIQKEITFKESIFIKAIRNGWWVILDELNLAQSDVLEVLNRLLDDNKEIFVPHIDEIIKAHPDFRLFATQNLSYGGRKGISKAFRNRFVEVFAPEKDDQEILEILHLKTKLPKSFCTKMVSVYTSLKNQRSIDCLITLRDLFKWANRIPRTLFEVYEVGMSIIYESQRSENDKCKVEQIFKNVFGKLDSFDCDYVENSYFDISYLHLPKGFVITKSVKKLLKLLNAAMSCKEPILLIGETGIGKTKICEEMSKACGKQFTFLNLHSGTESSDFLGNFYIENGTITWKNGALIDAMKSGNHFLIDEINLAEDAVLERLNSLLEDKREIYITETDENITAHQNFRIFATMNPGNDFGKRELSPALRNRFTEIYFELSTDEIREVSMKMLNDKIYSDVALQSDLVRTQQVVYGNDASNRGSMANLDIRNGNIIGKSIDTIKHDYVNIVRHSDLSNDAIDNAFINQLTKTKGSLRKFELYCDYVRAVKNKTFGIVKVHDINMSDILREAFELVFGNVMNIADNTKVDNTNNKVYEVHSKMNNNDNSFGATSMHTTANKTIENSMHTNNVKIFGIDQYYFTKSVNVCFNFENATTRCNLKKILRALVVQRGILLEGEPGVGKTSIVNNIAKMTGIKCIRINLCDQTELSDLVGTYLPIEGSIIFVKSELYNALENGWWIILDEINLCSQSVLEGLNSVLDYRRMLVLPECSIKVHPCTKIFATMNPYNSTNGRKILPRSFLDRFVKIRMSEYTQQDMDDILSTQFSKYTLYPTCSLRENIKRNMILKSSGNVTYEITENSISIGNFSIQGDTSILRDNDFVLLHSQLPQLEEILQAVYYKIPVIIVGGLGMNSLCRFISKIFDYDIFELICHKEIDNSDMIGQYHKDTDGKFVWKNSNLINAVVNGRLIVLHNPELIDKSIFDRCNSLFEADKYINVYEKGIDTNITVNGRTTFMMHVDNLTSLSPAVRDRCHIVHLSNTVSYIDAWKLFFKTKSTYLDYYSKDIEMSAKKQKQESASFLHFQDWIQNDNVVIENMKLEKMKFEKLNHLPSVLTRRLRNTYNEIIEGNIDKIFTFEEKQCFYDEAAFQYVDFYRQIAFDIKQGVNDIEKCVNIMDVQNSNENIKCITFIKNSNLSVFDLNCYNNCNVTKMCCNKNGSQYDEDQRRYSCTNSTHTVSSTNHERSNQDSACTDNICCDNCKLAFPTDLRNLKEMFLASIKHKTLKDIAHLQTMKDALVSTSLSFKCEFDHVFFDMLNSFTKDPMIVYREYLTYKKTYEENRILQEIYKTMKSLYKYGEGTITGLVQEYNELVKYYESEISKINDKLDRNYTDFITKLASYTFCSYICNEDVKKQFDMFHDITDYYLIYLFRTYASSCNAESESCICSNIISIQKDVSNKNILDSTNVDRMEAISANLVQQASDSTFVASAYSNSCQNKHRNTSAYKNNTYKNLVANCLTNERFDITRNINRTYIGNALCKFMFNVKYNKSIDITGLVLEACYQDVSGVGCDSRIQGNYENKCEYADVNKELQIPEMYLNECLQNMFKPKEISYLFEHRVHNICIGQKVIKNLCLYDELDIFINPEALASVLSTYLIENKNYKIQYMLENMDYTEKSYENEMIVNDITDNNCKDILNSENESHVTCNNMTLSESSTNTKGMNFGTKSQVEYDDKIPADFIKNKEIEYKKIETAYKLLEGYFKSKHSLHWEKDYKNYVYLLTHKLTPVTAERYFLDCAALDFYDKMYFAELQATSINDNLFYNLVLQYKAFEIEQKIRKEIQEAEHKLQKEPSLYNKIRERLKRTLQLPVTSMLDIKFTAPVCCCTDENIDNRILRLCVEGEGCICQRLIKLSENFDRNKIKDALQDMKEVQKDYIIQTFYNRKVNDKFSYQELCLSKVINKITEDATHLLLLHIALMCKFPPFLYFVFEFCNEQETSEDGTGIKSGTGDKNVSDQIKEEDEISDEQQDRQAVEEEDGVDYDNEGSMSTVEDDEEQHDVGVDNSNDDRSKDAHSNEDDKEDASDSTSECLSDGIGEDGSSDENKEDSIQEANNEDDGISEGDSSENDTDASKEDDLENSTVENMEGSGDGNEHLGTDDEEDVQNDHIINEYKYKEGIMNQNQTCDEAIDYERRVFGYSEVQTLCPGDGTEQTEGKDEKGDKSRVDSCINIEFKETYCEKLVMLLRTILESNKNNKYKGDYKSGKKLNMKRLIPYIASDYRRDKIWMKRRKSDKKDYILRVFVDNSRSMYSQDMIDTLFDLLSKIKNSFASLHIPVEIYKFGNTCTQCEIQDMKFTDTETNIDWIDDYKNGINIILTDGVFQKTGFYNQSFLVILIDKNDIMNMSKVSVSDGTLFVQKYLTAFSLKYCIVKNADELVSTFIDGLSDLIKSFEL